MIITEYTILAETMLIFLNPLVPRHLTIVPYDPHINPASKGRIYNNLFEPDLSITNLLSTYNYINNNIVGLFTDQTEQRKEYTGQDIRNRRQSRHGWYCADRDDHLRSSLTVTLL
jgi:hypothetical protein